MTKEEKIDKILNELLDDFIKAKLPLMKGMTLFAKVQNAVNYIETLSPEPCDDCISKKAVDELSKELVHTTRDKADFLCNFWERLQKLPSVQPIRSKGKWEEWIDRNDYNDFESISYVCNKCHHIQYAATNFCSNCGADMREVEE